MQANKAAKLAIHNTCLMNVTRVPTCALTNWVTSSFSPLDLSNRKTHANPGEPCLEEEQTHKVICKRSSTHANLMSRHVFTDICRPLPTLSHKKHKYFDEKSCWAPASPPHEKFRTLHSDKGGKTTKHIQQLLEDCGITHKMMTTHAPQHNETHWEPHVVFDEGGPTLCHECIIVDPNDTPPVLHDDSHSPPTSDPSPAPHLTSSCLKGTTRPPVPHDDSH
jgi:hypothetical protein